jgi:hypothetical protein
LIMLTSAALALSPKRVRPSELLMYLATLYMTLKSNRHMAIFALIAGPMLADYSQHWLDTTRFTRMFSSSNSTNSGRRKVIFNVILLVPLIACLIKLKSVIYSPPTQGQIGVPLNAVSYLKANGITGNTFTDPNIWGGYLIWETPSNPVYIDGRIDMYGDEFMREYLGIIHGTTRWQEPFDKYGVQVAIVSPTSLLRFRLEQSPQWQQLYRDEMAVVFTRRK